MTTKDDFFDQDDLKSLVKQLTKYEKRMTGLGWNFLRGIFYGFGFFIGSALLAAAFIYIMSKLEGWSYIGNFIHDINQIVGKKP